MHTAHPTSPRKPHPALLATLGPEPWVLDGYTGLCCSPDGGVLAATGNAGVWLMRADDGTLVRCLEGASAVALSSDGTAYAAHTTYPYTVEVRRISDGALLRTLTHELTVCDLTLSPDEQKLLLFNGGEAHLLDARDGRELGRFPGGAADKAFASHCKAAFTSDGRFAVIHLAGALHRWDLRDLSLTRLAEGEWVHMCAVGADVVAIDQTRLVRLDVSAGRVQLEVQRAYGALGLVGQGAALYVHEYETSTLQQLLTRYDAETLSPRSDASGAPRLNSGDMVAVHGERCWILSGGRVVQRALTAQTPQAPPTGSRARCTELRFGADGAHLSAIFWHYGASSALRFSLTSGALVASVDGSGDPLKLNPEGDHAVGRLSGGASPVARVALTPGAEVETLAISGGELALGRGGAVVHVDKAQLTLLPAGERQTLPSRHPLTRALSWDEDAGLLVASYGTTTAAYDLRAGAMLPKLATKKSVAAPALRGGRAWVLGEAGVAVWDLRTGARLQEIRSPHFNEQRVASLAVSKDETLLAVGMSRGRLALVPVHDPSRAVVWQVCYSNADKITACAFSDDGTLLATGSESAELRSWDVGIALAAGAPKARPTRAAQQASPPPASPPPASPPPTSPPPASSPPAVETIQSEDTLSFKGANFCITGRFPELSNADLEILLRARGANMAEESPNKRTRVVFSGAPTGKKVDKARALGVPVYFPEDVRAVLGPPLAGYRARFEALRAARGDRTNERVLAIGDRASDELLARVEARIGFPLPQAARNLWTQLDGLCYLWTWPDPPGATDPTPISRYSAINMDGTLWRQLYATMESAPNFRMGLCCIPDLETIFFGDRHLIMDESTSPVHLGKRKIAAKDFYPNLFMFDYFHSFYQAGLFADQERKELFVVYCADCCADWDVAAPVPLEIYMEYLLLEWGRSRLISLTQPLGATTSIYRSHLSTILRPYER